MADRTKHKCPRPGCDVQVSNRLFACPSDWAALPERVKAQIYATSRMHVLEPRRREAFRAAEQAWGVSK